MASDHPRERSVPYLRLVIISIRRSAELLPLGNRGRPRRDAGICSMCSTRLQTFAILARGRGLTPQGERFRDIQLIHVSLLRVFGALPAGVVTLELK
ncbi:expressed unknown protein [Ectocarpus siliculosus]|uniref:Uncharacterized protein n=1 Tax=Ectocarpus siliculosus TaxID=2880 RepID=D7G5J7_ECTSI|nr:expressed unknown protein [Ectocarpus siliculosus]|eukprot:CBJ27320.1 expressed unknown protein [Ectocarpus siliculosus]